MIKSNNIKVSIVVPVYNNEKYIENCLQSLLNQTYKDIEIIVVDDGSTDDSGKIIDDFARKDKRIIPFHQTNQGVSFARNIALDYAKGDYVTFVDGDDYVSETYIEKYVNCAQKNRADLVLGGICFVNTKGKHIKKLIPGSYKKFEKEEWVFRIGTVAVHLYKRELWEKYKVRFPVGVRGEDMPISLFFMAMSNNIVTLPVSEYFYVQHKSSATHNFTGLKNYRLPYESLENMICKINDLGIVNGFYFHELYVFRILLTFIQLAKGASKEEIEKLSKYINHIIDTYYKQYKKNPYMKVFSDLDVPFSQKIYVNILANAKRFGCVKILLNILC